jgi:putative addiction module component (TIGR02574 family)
VAIDPILHQALALPESERAEVAAALLASIGPEPEHDQEAVDRAWAAELKRRIDRVESGEDVPIPAEEALAEVRRSLRA